MLPAGMIAVLTLATNQFGSKFLAANKEKPGVTTLSSGLQYKVLREGEGDCSPTITTSCLCHYEGRTAQEYMKDQDIKGSIGMTAGAGKTFDSSYAKDKPLSFSPR